MSSTDNNVINIAVTGSQQHLISSAVDILKPNLKIWLLNSLQTGKFCKVSHARYFPDFKLRTTFFIL